MADDTRMNEAQEAEMSVNHVLDNQLLMWVQMSPGEFTLQDVFRDFAAECKTYHEKILFVLQLEKFVEEGLLQRSGDRRGHYRPTQLECKPIDFSEVDERPENIFLPMNIGNMVNIYPGNIITVAGEKNSGKTAFLLNTARGNRDGFDVHYYNSEAGPPEMLTRLKKFEADQMPFSEWNKVKFYERNEHFAEVIKPGEGVINIIDFLEIHDEFYKVGGYIRDIFDALNGAIAIIAIQKNPGSDDPIGGRRSTEKSRLHLAMSPNKIKITVAKNWKDPETNPNGLECNFKLVQGFNFYPTSNIDGCIWYRNEGGQAMKPWRGICEK